MKIQADSLGACLCIKVSAGEVDITVAEEFKETVLAAYNARSGKNLLLDLTPVSFMDSKAIGAMVFVRKAVARRGGKMGLCGLHPHVRKIISVVTLGTIFELFADQEEAAKTFCSA